MKRKNSVGLGPGAPSLILIFVVLALCMLGMLALMNGRNDAKLSERSVDVIEAVYALNAEAEVTRAELDQILAENAGKTEDNDEYLGLVAAALPAGMEMEGSDIVWTESDELRNLHCRIRVLPLGSSEREEWVQHTMMSAVAEEALEEEMFDW